MAVKPVPDGYHSVTPSLNVQGAAKLIDFAKRVFGAQEAFRMPGPDGAIMHAELKIGDSIVMVGEAVRDPATKASLYVYVKDVDATYKQALGAGGTSLSEPTNMFWGDRVGRIKDAFGNTWGIATHVEDVSPQEMKKRGEAFMKQQAKETAAA